MNNTPQNKDQPFDPNLGSILNLLRDIPVLNSPPSDTPRTPISFALYENGGTRRFYIFFNGNWRYVTLT
ncbi:MAG: hypothetical protein BWY14_00323 [Parcubacteria group bacterium ADurb.Bin192]|nr:MAG: hypothetical protein BWY14_00323 [Parcubacteria group bacterium ADurb.Bin192]